MGKKIGQVYNGKLYLGTVKPSIGRDFAHVQEVLHGSGCGAHKGKRDVLRRQERRAKQSGYRDC